MNHRSLLWFVVMTVLLIGLCVSMAAPVPVQTAPVRMLPQATVLREGAEKWVQEITINEVYAAPVEGAYEWIELYAAVQHLAYLPLVISAHSSEAVAAGPGVTPSGLVAPPGSRVDISGHQITDGDGNSYRVPDALPPLPPDSYVLIVFDGQGPAADEYDLTDGVATLHTPPGLVDVLEDDGDQVAFYTSGEQNAANLRDFVAFGRMPGEDAAHAVVTRLWPSGRWVSTEVGSGSTAEGAALMSGRSIGLYARRDTNGPGDWCVYQGGDLTPGAANPVARASWSTLEDGAVLGSDAVAIGWSLTPGAVYQFELDDDRQFRSPLVQLRLTGPSYVPDNPLPAGRYWWRVRAIDPRGQASAWSDPAQVTIVAVTGAAAASDGARAAQVVRQAGMPMTYVHQNKDTRLLCLDGDREGDPDDTSPEDAWDSVHPADKVYDHGTWNCYRAAVAMVASRYGGVLSQDYLSYIYFENEGNPIEGQDWVAGPSGDLGHSRGTTFNFFDGSPERDLLAWALGVAKYQITFGSDILGYQPSFDLDIVPWLDAGRPILISKPQNAQGTVAHAVVIRGYRVLDSGNEQVHVFDPWAGMLWQDYASLKILAYSVPPSIAPGVRSDPASVWLDTDSDGIYDFDELVRFPTSHQMRDSDRDLVPDKKEIRAYLFSDSGTWIDQPWAWDWDQDGLVREIDPDNDNGGAMDGCEDSNQNGKWEPELGETSNTDPSQEMQCEPPCGWTQSATISVDGSSADWAGLDYFADAVGDNTGGAAYDITKVLTAIDHNYAYIMVETRGKPFAEGNVEINLDYKPGSHIDHSDESWADLHTNIAGEEIWAWMDTDGDGTHEPFPISGYTVARGDVLEARIPLSELENTYYLSVTFINIWAPDMGQPGNDPTEICYR